MDGETRNRWKLRSWATGSSAIVWLTAVGAQNLPDAGPGLERVPAADPRETITAEVPEQLLQKLRADLAARAGAAADGARIVRAEAIIWPDGGLGCGTPGETYTQAPVPGYRIVVEVEGRALAYHASERGFLKLCGGPRPIGIR
jgi:hypothetical protein